MEALVVRNLNKRFLTGLCGQKELVLNNVSFDVPLSSITGFVGVNGSGKTTVIKCLLGFIFPETSAQTKISFFGQNLFSASVRRRIGYLPERSYLPEYLKAEEFLWFHWQLGGGTDYGEFEAKCREVLARVKLSGVEKKVLRKFSKGMLQRIGLAQCLLHKPDFFILDEPMSGLDPDGRQLVKGIIKAENRRGAAVFFSSHLVSDMDELCSHLVVIDQGVIQFSGVVGDFIHDKSCTTQIHYLTVNGRQEVVFVSGVYLQAKIIAIIQEQGKILRVVPEEGSIEKIFAQRLGLESSRGSEL